MVERRAGWPHRLGLAILALGLGLMAGCSRPAPPTNLLFITLDTLRSDRLGVYGYDRPTSPNLDAFAAESVVFTDATASIPTTLPSHVSIFTGLPVYRHGIRRNGQVPKQPLHTIFTLLNDQGRATAGIVAAKVLDGRFFGTDAGFDELIWEPGGEGIWQIRAASVNEKAAAWLDQHAADPFALWLHYYDPHEPYDPEPEWAEPFTGDYQGPLPAAMSVEALSALNLENGTADLTERDLRYIDDLYDAEVAYLDHHLGEVLAMLDTHGVRDQTVVVMVADHGQAHGENRHDYWGHGQFLVEPSIKVPMLIHVPGRAARTVDIAVENLDLMPTLASIFELDTADDLPGRDLGPAMIGETMPSKRVRVSERRTWRKHPDRLGVAIHGGDWKLTYFGTQKNHTYHLGRADGEGGIDGEDFFSPDGPEAAQITRLLDRIEASARAVDDTPLDAETRAALEALGYL
ncbi:MAG: sulfatase [Acidobacteriota bacterium]